MEINKGDKVIYLPTGEKAIVTKLVGKELVYIKMDLDKEEIPAFLDDVAPILSDVSKKEPAMSDRYISDVFYKEDLKEGLYLIVQYKMGQMDEESMLPVFLYNHSNRTLVFDLNYYSEDSPAQQIKGKLASGGIDLIHHISFKSLECQPTFELDWVYDDQPNVPLTSDIVIKPNVFFKKYGSISIVNSSGSMYYVQAKKTETQSGSLSEYTRKERRTAVLLNQKKASQRQPSAAIKERAEFNPVLDLHIDKIHQNPSSMRKGEILQYQMNVFDRFIEKAIKLKVQQIFIIHGVGNGRLKDEIATKLIQHSGVNTFKNEYNESYGFGATEVWLY